MGRLTQNLQFNVGSNIQYAQQKGIAGAGQAANEGRFSPVVSETMKQFLGVMPKLAKVEMQEGRKTLEKGRLAGFRGQPIAPETEASGFGAAFEKSAEQVAKELRDAGEITLVDDPYFQEGYFQAQGEMETVKFANETKAWYESVKENPNLYKDREAFENALRLRFDLAFSQLPRNRFIQAGFMKNITPLVANLQSQYKIDLNKYHTREYLVSQRGKTGGSILNFREELRMIDELSPEDTMVLFERFPELSEFAKQVEVTPDMAKALLEDVAYADMIEDLDEIGRDLAQFQGENEFGLGVNPTEARLEFILDSVEDPELATRIIKDLGAGTGKLADTARGKAALAKIYNKAVEKEKENYIEDVLLPAGELNADITYVDVYSERAGQSVEESVEELTVRIDQIFPADAYPEENAKMRAKLANAHRRTERVSETEKIRRIIENSVAGIVGDPTINTDLAAQALGTLASGNKSHTSKTLKDSLGQAHQAFYKGEMDGEQWWKLVETVDKFNTQSGTSLRVAHAYGSPSVLNNSPEYLNMLYEADSRGLLGTFVDDDTEVYQAIKATQTDAQMSQDQRLKAFNDEIRDIKAKKRVEDLGELTEVKLTKIPIATGGDVTEVDYTEIVKKLVPNSGKLKFVPDNLSLQVAELYLDAFRRNSINNPYKRSVQLATEEIQARVSIEEVGIINYDGINDNLYILRDTEATEDLYAILEKHSGGDPDLLKKGIRSFGSALRARTNFAVNLDLFKGRYAETVRQKESDELGQVAESRRNEELDRLAQADAAKKPSQRFQSINWDELYKEVNPDFKGELLPVRDTDQSYDAGVGIYLLRQMEKNLDDPKQIAGLHNFIINSKNPAFDYLKPLLPRYQAQVLLELQAERDSLPDNLKSTGFNDSDDYDDYRRALELELDPEFDHTADIVMYEVRPGFYGFMDVDGNTLNYKNAGYGQFIMTPQEVAYHMDAARYESSEYLWPSIGPVITQALGVTEETVPDNERMQEYIFDYFDKVFTEYPSDATFKRVFGNNAYTMKMKFEEYLSRGMIDD